MEGNKNLFLRPCIFGGIDNGPVEIKVQDKTDAKGYRDCRKNAASSSNQVSFSSLFTRLHHRFFPRTPSRYEALSNVPRRAAVGLQGTGALICMRETSLECD